MLFRSFPLAYGIISILRGQWFPDVSDRFPYPFFDPTISGWGGVVLGLLEVVLANAVIAVAVIALDRLSAKIARVRRHHVESTHEHRSGITGELPEEQGASPQ